VCLDQGLLLMHRTHPSGCTENHVYTTADLSPPMLLLLNQVQLSAVEIYNVLALNYPAEFPPLLFIHAGQRVLMQLSCAGDKLLRQEAVATVLCHLVNVLGNEQIQDESDHAAAIQLAAVVARQTTGECLLLCWHCRR
jgi:hypothetical protein